MTIKEQLENYRKEIYGLESRRNNIDNTMMSIGFQDAAELLLPLVEACEYYAGKRLGEGGTARKALQELREKLK